MFFHFGRLNSLATSIDLLHALPLIFLRWRERIKRFLNDRVVHQHLIFRVSTIERKDTSARDLTEVMLE